MSQPDNMTLRGTVSAPRSDSNNDRRGPSKPRDRSLSDLFAWPGRIVLLALIVLAPWAKGSVNPWAQQWIAVGLLFCLAFWWFETALNSRKKQIFPYIFFPLTVGLGIGLFQLVPLPDWLTGIFLGRQKEIFEQFTGLTDPSLTISLDPEETWGQIRLLVIATAGLLLGCRFFRTKRDIVLLMTVGALNGVALSCFAIVQRLTAEPYTMYWVYPIPETPEVYGPFVNPNNSAGFLLMGLACAIGLLPIVMSERKRSASESMVSSEMPWWRQMYIQILDFISELTATKLAAVLAVLITTLGVVGSISRGGIVALFVGGIGTLLIYGMARRPKNSTFLIIPLVGMVLALATWIGLGDKIVHQFSRIDVVDIAQADVRLQLWKDMIPSVSDFGPFGSGLGSHKGVHRLYRTAHEDALYVFAENQFIQALIEAGWPGLILFLIAWYLFYKCIALMLQSGQSVTTIGVGAMGIFLFFSQAVASMFDFGFYIGANLLFLSVLVGFVAYHGQSLAGRLKKKSWLRFNMPNYSIQVIVLVLFAFATMVAMDFHRRAKMDALMQPKSKALDFYNMPLAKTDQRIAALTPMVQQTPSIKGLNYLGELWMHRFRLMMMEDALADFPNFADDPNDSPEVAELKQKEKDRLRATIWNRTHIQWIHENLYYWKRVSRYEATRFQNSPAIQENLPSAATYFSYSTRESPLQPVIHLRLGLIKGVIQGPRDGDADIERAVTLAPRNGPFRQLAGNYYLQSGEIESAVPHMRRVLELTPGRFDGLMDTITGKTSADTAQIPDKVVLDQLIPDDPMMLYKFATIYLDDDSPSRPIALSKAKSLVAEAEFTRREDTLLLAAICREQGDLEESARYYKLALTSQPNDPNTRHKRAKVLERMGNLDEALEEATKLARENQQKTVYTKYKSELEAKIARRDREAKNE